MLILESEEPIEIYVQQQGGELSPNHRFYVTSFEASGDFIIPTQSGVDKQKEVVIIRGTGVGVVDSGEATIYPGPGVEVFKNRLKEFGPMEEFPQACVLMEGQYARIDLSCGDNKGVRIHLRNKFAPENTL